MDFIGSITGLFGNKGNSYYMELKEETQEANVTQVVAPVAPVAATPAAVAPVASTPAAVAPVAPVAPKAEPVKISVPTETNFATKYLIPQNTPRRRPGVNMNSFLDMARQVKTPV
ncbi:hypothetical protein PN478_18885 [Dolichospermum circinale CS-534/05]|uniref:hypothetical protein n=1 Tax=Dolichospermum circinale TaxID=109265 RepID=UPI00232B2DA8|nr:hypothetical protein [Dolichospermum circinale]MDB9453547.1 hypothetical protein [Dolichospermum circinale CS-541/06]MDB9462941.1 hypothetical protein [Dolichospermum circinale CS-541/04]MDB9492572.1 hypothetical protein [Dolichospermum circinale CS-534/05]MDB9546603.1 hypothetical protein [Dolichospermum circinale CS-1031]